MTILPGMLFKSVIGVCDDMLKKVAEEGLNRAFVPGLDV